MPLSKKEEVNLQNGNDMNFDSSKSPIKEIISDKDEGIRTEVRDLKNIKISDKFLSSIFSNLFEIIFYSKHERI